MADPLGSLEKIVKLALRIKEAVDTVRQNKEECQQIRTRAVRVSSLLSRLPETGMTADPAMCGALEDLEDSLRRAHTLVAACQETTTVCIYCTAGRQARRLRRVQDDISQKVMLVVFATNIQTTIILTNIRTGEAGPPEQAAGEITETPVVDPCNLSTGGPLQSSAIMKSGLSSLPRRMSLNANSGSEGEVETNNNVPTRSKVPSASGLLDGMEHSQAAQPLTSPSLTTATWDEPDSPIDRLAVREDTHSLSTSDFCKKLAVREGLKKFGLSELEAATHHFSVENMVGSGAFATVYKGVLQDGLVVAIKKFRYPNVLSAEHIDELHIVSKFKHKNIVKLIGYGSDVLEGGEQCEDAKVRDKEDKQTSFLFVEEYMPNGSLDKIINGLQVDWSSRFLLILGIARGLRYLHKRNIVHLDVKPSNILLDYDMNPKITDFGMTRVLNHKGVDIYSDIGTIAGTLGYMPPEYITDGTLSKKHDVYSFGVTLLDIISSMSRFKRISNQSSIEWAWEVRQAGRTMELLDPSLFDVSQLKEIQKCVEVGLLCTQFNPVHRPGMRTALKMLHGEKALRIPVRPGYTKEPAASCFGGWSCLRVRL